MDKDEWMWAWGCWDWDRARADVAWMSRYVTHATCVPYEYVHTYILYLSMGGTW